MTHSENVCSPPFFSNSIQNGMTKYDVKPMKSQAPNRDKLDNSNSCARIFPTPYNAGLLPSDKLFLVNQLSSISGISAGK